MSPSDPIEAPTRSLPEAALVVAQRNGSFRTADLKVYLNEVYSLCQRSDIGLDASIIVAQSAHETAYWGELILQAPTGTGTRRSIRLGWELPTMVSHRWILATD